MPDYSKTVIYKIQHKDNQELVYVGSTTNYYIREIHHKSLSTKKSQKVYKMIRENGGWDCFMMTKVKDFPCNTKQEAQLEEDRVMLNLEACMNTYRPSRSRLQYYNDNKQSILEMRKHHYDENRERILQIRKQHYIDNKSRILQSRKQRYQNKKITS